MTTPHLQPEYIITESQLNFLEWRESDGCIPLPDGSNLITKIRSRPHSTASNAESEQLGFTEFCEIHCDHHECCTNECERSGRQATEKVLDTLEAYAEACRYENECRGKSEKEEIVVAGLAGAAIAFEGMVNKIEQLRTRTRTQEQP